MKFKFVPQYYQYKYLLLFRKKAPKDIIKKITEYLYIPTYAVVDKNNDVVCVEVTDFYHKYINYYIKESYFRGDIFYIQKKIYDCSSYSPEKNIRPYIKDYEKRERRRIFDLIRLDLQCNLNMCYYFEHHKRGFETNTTRPRYFLQV